LVRWLSVILHWFIGYRDIGIGSVFIPLIFVNDLVIVSYRGIINW
jgi:hypothetical protein